MRTLPPTPTYEIGKALRRWRIINGVKQASLATEFKVSQSTISKWESGELLPDCIGEDRIVQLISSYRSNDGDRALVRLVEDSSAAVHLICDFSHRLLAASSVRSAQWRVDKKDLIGSSLWRFATEGIANGEDSLSAKGWYEPFPADVFIETECAEFSELTIRSGVIRYARMPLATGGYARLVWDEPQPE